MTLVKNMIRLSIYRKHFHTTVPWRNKSITGYEGADNALQTVTGGRIYKWLDAYEDFVGLTEVKQAQTQVTEAESSYRAVQEQRRAAQQQLTAVQVKIKGLAMEIEKTKRGTDAYLDLVTKENEIIKDEKDVLENLSLLEDNEKQSFTLLSSALRESHEKERARAERMKYWGVMGSIIGAVIGIFGTTVNNYLRMKELRKIVTMSTESNQESRERTLELCLNVNDQYRKIHEFLMDIRSKTGLKPVEPQQKGLSVTQTVGLTTEAKLEEVIETLKEQESRIRKDLEKLGHVLMLKHGNGLGSSDAAIDSTVVYVGPEIQTMLNQTEQNIERKMTHHSVGTVVFVAAAIAVPILLKLFSGS
ncbi:MITOK-like protein [Mya arenaria]|uniref:MITOK-like protein n=1 Tax=Mya arenaria TaxID=6604 RepID=A0ABY7FX35_MYAAR|nr:mitochondrial potassium channel-like [Mya arenaria]WAR25844.1 MITOK-like protein [Mya arenaria]